MTLLSAIPAVIFDPMIMVMVSIGTLFGIIIGAIPGLTATMAIALLVPLSYGQPMLHATGLLLGIYVGGMYGGSISAILINVPGAPCSAATMLDGYPLAKKGMAGKAIATSTIASTFGGLFSVIILIFCSTALAKFALRFAPPEYFVVAFFGLTMVIAISDESAAKGFVSAGIGLLISTVGLDPMVPLPRFTFGSVVMLAGLPIVPVLIGVFAFSQVFQMLEELASKKDFAIIKIERRFFLSFSEFKSILKTLFRSSIIGTIVGIIPAAGPNIAAFVGYSQAKKASKTPEKFGTGELNGVAGAEAANNAVPAGALVPLLTFGIPGDTVTAILLGAFILHGYQPGPLLFKESPHIVYPLFIILILANIWMLFFGLVGIHIFPKIISSVSQKVLIAIVGVCGITGGFVYSGMVSEAVITVVFGIFGYLFTKCGFSVLPLSITVILGPLIEVYFRQSLITSQGDLTIFFTRPICIVLWVITIFTFYGSIKLNKRIQVKGSSKEVQSLIVL